MAGVKNIKFESYCDRMYTELASMRSRLLGFVKEIELMTGPEREILKPHIAHFQDIAKTIEWKLEILGRVCPFDWKGDFSDLERTVSVQIQEDFSEKDAIAGGYLGG
jgi:hypothetical protein